MHMLRRAAFGLLDASCHTTPMAPLLADRAHLWGAVLPSLDVVREVLVRPAGVAKVDYLAVHLHQPIGKVLQIDRHRGAAPPAGSTLQIGWLIRLCCQRWVCPRLLQWRVCCVHCCCRFCTLLLLRLGGRVGAVGSGCWCGCLRAACLPAAGLLALHNTTAGV
jgi:hypothetical protein